MAIILNPDKRRFSFAVDDENTITLILRAPTTAEMTDYMNKRLKTDRRGNTDESKVMRLRIKFIDLLLIDIEARGPSGQPEELLYIDENGEQKPLTTNVENWRKYINATLKMYAAVKLETEHLEVEDETLKN